MKLRQLSPLSQIIDTDVVTQDKYVPGYVFIKSVQLTPAISANWTTPPSRVVIDVPEAPFSKFRSLEFRINAFSANTGTASVLYMGVRKNGGAVRNSQGTTATMYYQVFSVYGAATNYITTSSAAQNGNSEGIPISVTGSAIYNSSYSVRGFKVTLDSYGYDSYVGVATSTTLPVNSINIGTGSFQIEGSGGTMSTPWYTDQDFGGISLAFNTGAGITPARYSSNFQNEPVICDVYGVLKNDPAY